MFGIWTACFLMDRKEELNFGTRNFQTSNWFVEIYLINNNLTDYIHINDVFPYMNTTSNLNQPNLQS